jgi:hypothetical protein
MARHVTQSVGDFTLTFTHPLVAGGTAIPIKGIKLDEVFVSTAQEIDNSKRVLLVNGDTVALTNFTKAGKLTVNAIRVSDNILDGDMIMIANFLSGIGDNVGGIIRITYGFDGGTEAITFTGVTYVSCPPVLLAGNDLPVYPVVWSYGEFIRI